MFFNSYNNKQEQDREGKDKSVGEKLLKYPSVIQSEIVFEATLILVVADRA